MRLASARLPCLRGATACVLALLSSVLLPGRALATEPRELTPFERRTLVESAGRLKASPEIVEDAEGKLIERVDVVVIDVFDEHDPVPDFVNVFHTMSRENVIRRELLFAAGERFQASRVDASARGLRQLQQLSLVLVVPLPGSAPDRVRVLVIVKDVWSLRLNNRFTATGGGFQSFSLQPSEENLAGLHTILAANFDWRPDTYAFGGLIGQRRILGTSLDASVSASVIYGRASGEAEGSTGQFIFGDPLRNAQQRWAYGVGIYWYDAMLRRLLTNGRTARYDAPSTPGNDGIVNEYRAQRYIGGYEVTRSYGSVEKRDLTLGIEADRRQNVHLLEPGVSAAAERDFLAAWVPLSDTRVSPFVQLHTHSERFLHTSELETLALQEEYVLGVQTLVRAYPASSKLASTRNLLGLVTGASLTLPVVDGLVRLIARNRVEYELDGRHDADALGEAFFASPKSVAGRLILDAFVRTRYENYLNREFELGGDTRLRGYAQAGYQGSLKGPLAVMLNAEWRTPSLDILSMHTGLAAFYDAGDAADRFADVFLRQSAGIGLRLLFPEFDRVVLRADWAFPFNPTPGYPTFPGALYIAYEQALSVPGLRPATVMDPDALGR